MNIDNIFQSRYQPPKVRGFHPDAHTTPVGTLHLHRLADMKTPRISMGCIRLTGARHMEILAVGGGDGGSNLFNTVESYNMTTNQWTLDTPLNMARQSVSLGLDPITGTTTTDNTPFLPSVAYLLFACLFYGQHK
jgi:hypothetical protein